MHKNNRARRSWICELEVDEIGAIIGSDAPPTYSGYDVPGPWLLAGIPAGSCDDLSARPH